MSGPQCCENPPTLDSTSGGGVVEQFGGLTSYISGPPYAKSAVILISDVFGFEAPLLRKIADKVGDVGFHAVALDFLHRNPWQPDQKPLFEWLQNHSPDQGFEDVKPVIEALRNKGVAKIGAVGFCWGAKVVAKLAKYACIQAGVLLHPSFVTVEDFQGVKVPLCILGAEVDQFSPPELVRQFEAVLNMEPEVDCFVKIFPGVSHGWSVRYDDGDEAAVKSAQESHKDIIDWFIKHLK